MKWHKFRVLRGYIYHPEGVNDPDVWIQDLDNKYILFGEEHETIGEFPTLEAAKLAAEILYG